MSQHLLLEDGIQHTLHGCLHILDGIIDHAVQADIHSFSLSRLLGHSIRTHVKSDNDGVGGRGKADIRLVDGSHSSVDDLHNHLVVGQLQEALLQGLHRALYISLHDDAQLFQIALLDLGKQIVKRQLGFCLLQKLRLVL